MGKSNTISCDGKNCTNTVVDEEDSTGTGAFSGADFQDWWSVSVTGRSLAVTKLQQNFVWSVAYLCPTCIPPELKQLIAKAEEAGEGKLPFFTPRLFNQVDWEKVDRKG